MIFHALQTSSVGVEIEFLLDKQQPWHQLGQARPWRHVVQRLIDSRDIALLVRIVKQTRQLSSQSSALMHLLIAILFVVVVCLLARLVVYSPWCTSVSPMKQQRFDAILRRLVESLICLSWVAHNMSTGDRLVKLDLTYLGTPGVNR